ncbi:hypothetical protein BHC47_10535 [Snodgrassella alvi]|uniref:Uncharacterized protein n=1 Tax=Snodgrassella alvi TaxID=1196083 RepID=A0A2N9Y4V6_9NEIS|nr:hypothetical protein BHC56_00545 [Snodgrassella alvi]PIT63290.1 hypothetical protein BHC47_10535 [Snodgrassella alvi]
MSYPICIFILGKNGLFIRIIKSVLWLKSQFLLVWHILQAIIYFAYFYDKCEIKQTIMQLIIVYRTEYL